LTKKVALEEKDNDEVADDGIDENDELYN